MLSDLTALVRVLVRPHATFRFLVVRRPLLAPWIAAVIVHASLALLAFQAASVALESGSIELPPSALERARSGLEASTLLAAVFAPVGVTVTWGAAGALLWAWTSLLGTWISFRGALVIAAYGSVPTVLAKIVEASLHTARGELTLGPATVHQLTSVAGFFPDSVQGGWLTAVATQLNVFSLATLALWCVGTVVFAPDRRNAGTAAAAAAWCFGSFMSVVTTRLGQVATAGLPGLPG